MSGLRAYSGRVKKIKYIALSTDQNRVIKKHMKSTLFQFSAVHNLK